MNLAGLILVIFGGVLLFASAFALASLKTKEKLSKAEIFDLFIFGRFFGFFYDLFRASAEGVRQRSSPAFVLLLLFIISLGMIALGGIFFYF